MLALAKKLLGISEAAAAPGQVAYYGTTSASTTGSWEVPAGVTTICVVCVGGGAPGTVGWSSANGGGAGAMAYANDVSVTPGESLSYQAGRGGSTPADSWLKRGATSLCLAKCGSGTSGGSAAGCVGDVKYSGGNGGTGSLFTYGGGGGAGGYAGSGGNSAATGTGGSGTGGAAGAAGGEGNNSAAGGGGVALLGQGSSGTGGTAGNPGGGGSGGDTGATVAAGRHGGNYGGGGGGINSGSASLGGAGGVRLIWGSGRSFPSTNTGDV